ncbi:MAG: zf-HC2 domain-containing protein [Gemmataceae bacterium]|nr:zf-HC2 domain-containing protein [Gemmataceae bacterium]
MFDCNRSQGSLLAYLFDLLEPDEARQVEGHLAECAECRGKLDEAKGAKSLIAQAAKSSAPEVRFQAPVATRPRVVEPTQPRQRPAVPGKSGAGWKWAVAACVGLMVLGLGAIGGVTWFAHSREAQHAQARAQDLAAQQREADDRARKDREKNQEEIRAIQEQINRLVGDWNRERTKTEKVVQQQDAQFRITAPQSVQAGAKNEFAIEMRRQGKGPKKAEVQIVDEKSKKVLLSKPFDTDKVQLDLPQDVEIKPGMNLALVIHTEGQDGMPAQVREHLALVVPEYMTHLATDRPMYRPGETVRFRSLTLDRFTLKPTAEDLKVTFVIAAPNGQELFKQESGLKPASQDEHAAMGGRGGPPMVPELQPAGKNIEGPDSKPVVGIASGQFMLPPEVPGGQYVLHIKEASDRFPAEKRPFLVNVWQTPRFNKELDFSRSSFGPGEKVGAQLKIARVEGGALPAQLQVQAKANVDGKEVYSGLLPVSAEGRVEVSFALPKADQMERGSGSLSLKILDPAGVETIVRPIPILLKKLFVDFFPEGGELVQGVPNRVYFSAKTAIGKPADLLAKLVDDQGKSVVEKIETLTDAKEPGINQGMGRFEFTPEKGRIYELKIESPAKTEGKHRLPEAKAEGVAMRIPDAVVGESFEVEIRNVGKQRNLLVGAYCRGRLLDHVQATVEDGKTEKVTLRTTPNITGVYRVTVFERTTENGVAKFTPLSERLTCRKGTEKIHFAIEADKQTYLPGQTAKITIHAKSAKKEAVPAIALVSVVDLSVFKLADDKTLRSMPTSFLLTSEIQKPDDLENVDVLLGDHAKAGEAVDLLLGTQGWRRFAEQTPAKFRKDHPVEAPRLAMAPPRAIETAQRAISEKIDQGFATQFVEMQKQLATEENKAADVQQAAVQAQAMAAMARDAEQQARMAQVRLSTFIERMIVFSIGLALFFAFVGGILLLVFGMLRQRDGRPAALHLAFGGGMLGMLFLAVPLVLFTAAVSVRHEAGVAMQAAERAEAEHMAKDMANMPPPMAIDQLQPGIGGPPNFGAGGGMGGGVPGQPGVANPVFPVGVAVPVAPQPVMQPQFAPPGVPMIVPAAQPMPAPMPGPGGMPGMPPPQFGGDGLARPPQAPGIMAPQEPMVAPAIGVAPMPGGFGGAGMAFPGGPMGDIGPGFFDEATLRRQGRFRQLIQARLGRDVNVPLELPPSVVRVYAHKTEEVKEDVIGGAAGVPVQVRSDFAETLYWNPVVVFDKDGKAEVTFDLSESITRFQVTVAGHSLMGQLGQDKLEIVSKLPFSLDPKTPFEVTASDRIVVPVTITNETDREGIVALKTTLTGLRLKDEAPAPPFGIDLPPGVPPAGPMDRYFEVAVAAKNRVQQPIELIPDGGAAMAKLRIHGRFDQGGQDSVERSFRIVPDGLPRSGSNSGMLEKFAETTIDLNEAWISGTLAAKIEVFPSTLAQIQSGMEAMLQEPGGCFEQSSSSNYPNVMILSYLKEIDTIRPDVEKRARDLLGRGYQQLTSFECIEPATGKIKRGYEWFGQTAPPHEALTAYGLLQFKDMAKVHPVDQAMVERTKKYLLAQRDGKGGFKRNPQALDSFGRAPDHITNAYIVWSLTEADVEENLDAELKALYVQATKQHAKDPYFVSLVGIAHLNRGQSTEGLELMKQAKGLQTEKGNLPGAKTSITGSMGVSLEVETTALAMLGWVKANRPEEFQASIQKAMQWMSSQRQGGGFGQTQSTILALKALVAHAKASRKTTESGALIVVVEAEGGQPLTFTKTFSAGAVDPLEVSIPTNALKKGKNRLKMELTGKNAFPFSATWNYRIDRPANPANVPVKMTAKLDREKLHEGDTVKMNVRVTNTTDKGHGMAVAIVGIPAGLALPENHEQLKNLSKLRDGGTKEGEISYYEVRGRELVLYWRQLAPNADIQLDLDLVCRLPGEYKGPASRSYLYYQPELKYWIEPVTAKIEP